MPLEKTLPLDEASRKDESDGESRYMQMFEKNPAVQLLIDPQTGAIEDANPAAVKFYGYDLETLKRTNISDINLMPREEIVEGMRQIALEQRQQFLVQHRLASGAIRDVEVSSCPVMLGGRLLLHSIIHDITEQKRVGAAFRRQAEFEKLIAEISRLFLNLSPEEFNKGIHKAFQAIGELSGLTGVISMCYPM